MKLKKWKLFWQIGDPSKSINCIPFNDTDEYYSFVKAQFNNGFRQIIVSSEVMIELIKYCVINLDLNISKIEFNEDDPSLSEDITNLVETIKERPILFSKLIERLNFLAETSSIDISRVYINGRFQNGDVAYFFIQSNGILAFNECSRIKLLDDITTLIKRCLFG